MILVALTGSIGMGKSATLALFAQQGAAVYDADAAVHALYAKGGAAVEPVEAAFPGVVKEGAIDRSLLSNYVINQPDNMKRLEAIVHPLTRKSREEFMQQATGRAKVAIFDIPLLFEFGTEREFQATIVCSAPTRMQIDRALQRPNLSREKLFAILAKQTPDHIKRAKADYVIDTSRGEKDAKDQVEAVYQTIIKPDWRPTNKPGSTKT